MSAHANSKHRPEIDGLRAVAVLPVIFYHAGFSSFSGGYVGVDVFFVISGYLITRIIYIEAVQGTFSLSGFYLRRMRRIMPALMTVSLVCIPFAYLWMLPDELRDFSRSLLAINVFVSNVLFRRESGYFLPDTDLKPLIHTWSLSIEEQFYIIFPLALLLIYRHAPKYLFLAIAIICAVSFASADHASRHNPIANFYLMPFRAWELGMGALLALTPPNNYPLSVAARQIGSLLGMSLIIYAVFSFDDLTPFPSRWALFPVIGTLLIIGFSTASDFVGKLLTLRPVVFIGLVSYSAYLWHQPLFAFARLRNDGEPTEVMLAALIFATFFLAYATWRFIELPFRFGPAISARFLLSYLIPIGVMTSAFGAVGHFTNGFSRFASPSVQNISAHLEVNHGLSKICEGEMRRRPECRTSRAPKVLVWGDSFAMHLVDGLVADYPSIELLQRTMSVCGPVLDIAPIASDGYNEKWAKRCLAHNRDVLKEVRDLGSVRNAILSSPFVQYVGEQAQILHDGKIYSPSMEFIVEKMIITVAELREMGITTTVVSPPPSNGRDIGRCIAREIHLEGRFGGKCSIDKRDYEKSQERVIKFLSALESKGVHVVRLDNLLCDHEVCRVYEDGKFIYRDRGHLSKEGSVWLGRKHGFRELLTAIPPR